MSGGVQEHELRLKINAAAAKSGSREFTGAIRSIARAVSTLERDTTGAFLALKKGMQVTPRNGAIKAVNQTADAVKRLEVTAKNAMTKARSTTNAVVKQFAGDAVGIQKAEQALDRYQRRLASAKSPLDVVDAKADFRESIAGLKAEAAAQKEAASAAALHSKELVDLKTKFDPVFAVSNKYAQQFDELNEAKRLGAVNAQQYDAALERLNSQLAMGVVSSNKWGQSVRVSSAHMSAASANVVAQFNDIGVMLAAGQSPLLLAMQQGTQLSQVLNQMGGRGGVLATLKSGFLSMINPISLITIGSIALGAALFQTFTKGREKTKSFSESLSDARSALNELRSASDALAGGNLRQLRSEYGKVNDELDAHLERLQKVAQIEAATKNADLAASIRDAITSDGNLLTGDVDAVRRAFDTTNDRARTFLYMLADIKNARTFEDQAAAITSLRREVESTTGGLDKSEGAARGMLAQLIRAEDFALKLLAAMDGNTDATERSKGAAGGLTTSIGTAADEAARLVQNLGSVPSAFGMLDKSIGEQIASIQAQNQSLGLQLSEGLAAQAANRRVQLSDLVAAGTMTPDQAASEWAQIERLDGLLKRQEEMRKKLSESGKSTGGGGSSHRKGVIDEILRTTEGLEQQAYAYEAVRTGIYSSEEAANLFGRIMAENGGVLDEQTAKLLANIDAQARRNETLRNAPKNFSDNLADGVETSLEGAIGNAFTNGKFSARDFLNGIKNHMAGIFAKGLAQKFTAMLGLDKIFGSVSMQPAAAAAGATIGQSMVIAGGTVATQIATAISTGQAASGAAGAIGGGGGGFLKTAFSFVGGMFGLPFFSEGGYSDAPLPFQFKNAPHYAEGTANTSNGIPAVLHPNEAVVPLSRGRKIPVEMKGGAGGKSITMGDVHINVESNGEDDDGLAIKIAQRFEETVEGIVETKIAENAQYGGILNPRGGM